MYSAEHTLKMTMLRYRGGMYSAEHTLKMTMLRYRGDMYSAEHTLKMTMLYYRWRHVQRGAYTEDDNAVTQVAACTTRRIH